MDKSVNPKRLQFQSMYEPAMVEAMQETLSRAGVAENNIRTEEFYGY